MTAWFDEENEHEVACRLCQNKLTYNHLTGAMGNPVQHRQVSQHGQLVAAAAAAAGSTVWQLVGRVCSV